MKGINYTRTPWVDMEELKLVNIPDFDAFTKQVMISCAKSYQHFYTAKLSSQEFVLNQQQEELITLAQRIQRDDQHPDHETLKGLSHHEASEYLKLRYPCAYLGRSLNIRTTPIGKFPGKSKWANCEDGAAIENFRWLIEEILSWNVFDDLGRMVLFQNDHHSYTPIHRDWKLPDEFLWIGFGAKKFFVYDEYTTHKSFVNCRVAWFNNSDFHGTEPVDHAAISLRIDGVFKPEVRKLLARTKNPKAYFE